MSTIVPFKRPIPSYAVDLLLRAKNVLSVLAPSRDGMPECLTALEDAVIAFENNMPINSEGEIVEEGRA